MTTILIIIATIFLCKGWIDAWKTGYITIPKIMTQTQFLTTLGLNIIVLGLFGIHILSESTRTVVQRVEVPKIKLEPTIVVKHDTKIVTKTNTVTKNVCEQATEYMNLMKQASDICHSNNSNTNLTSFKFDNNNKPIFSCN